MGQPDEPTLSTSSAHIDLATTIAAKIVRAADNLASHAIRAFQATPVDWDPLTTAESMIRKLRQLMRRFKDSHISQPLAHHGVDGNVAGIRYDAWVAQTEDLISQLERTWIPITYWRRSRKRDRFHRKILRLQADLPKIRMTLLSQHYAAFVAGATRHTHQLVAAKVEAWETAVRRIPQLPPGIDGWTRIDAVVPGPGRLRLHVGAARLSPPVVTTLKPSAHNTPKPSTQGQGGHGNRRLTAAEAVRHLTTGVDQELLDRHVLPLPECSLPLILDLDRDGGLVTDSADVIASIILRLLALLPAGRMKVTVFDPRRLGDSATFLFGLGQATEAVMGDKIRTTDRELDALLLQTEEHITLITQKYLQGQYATLTDYNQAAGEVAEPYRILVLYDYPQGFRRGDGRYDDGASGRLWKVVKAGPRCGVFTLICSNELAAYAPAELSDPAISAAPGAAAPVRSTVGLAALPEQPRPGASAILPALYVNRMIAGDVMHRLLAAPRHETTVFNTQDPSVDTQLTLAWAHKDPFTFSATGPYWRFEPSPPLDPAAIAEISAAVERGVLSSADVRVTPARVAELALAQVQRNVARGTQPRAVVPHPADPATWWHGCGVEAVTASFGVAGAADVATLRFDSQTFSNVLMGGRPGSGKSVWLHAIIASLCQAYPPAELELYLVDFKEGVEFKVYASGRLPHARVVAIESERDFGVSVLASLDTEITRRGELFRGADGNQVNLSAYRAQTGAVMPRIVLVIDEFHVLFERDDKIAYAAGELLERIVRQGRAFGVHTLLASQTLAGTSGVGRHIFNLIPVRVALQSSDADSRLLLADDNSDARLLNRPGEGILNTKGGLKDANNRFQTAFWEPGDRELLVHQLRDMADRIGFLRKPVVFEGRSPADVRDVPIETIRRLAKQQPVTVPLGLPLTLDGPVGAPLRREPGANVLLVMPEDAVYGLLTIAVASLVAGGVACDILDFGSPDAAWSAMVADLASAANGGLTASRSRAALAKLKELATLVDERHSRDDYQSPARVALIVGLHRAREFDATAYDSEEKSLLERVLRGGPDVGVHVLAWCDKPVSLDRRLSSTALRDFGLRVLTLISKDDSFRLIHSDIASTLLGAQAVLDDHDKAVTIRFRWYGMPATDWVAHMIAPVTRMTSHE